MAQHLVEFVRSIMTNLDNGAIVPVDGSPKLILEFGVNIPVATNFVEFTTTVGWQATYLFVTPPQLPKLLLQIYMDGILVGSAEQKSIPYDEDELIEMTTTFQTVLTNVSTEFHVVQVYASNPEDLQGDITLTGPVNITGKVYAPV
ncbi:hypothetical protein C2I18_27540 [Paenibacillus sp. PK3_47]|uniref:hypothetical protein n=1 Tax=Paenibacillus sp. PK3_47 TaxID=2072642 RepID=UPI00201D5AD7|nr:hypothetical protein [Paenibacillus sp. PK3_47]UQZ36957.1 hypothetical protein C2I18_27540 [Paenibacillus sp. PK3_47]